MAPIRVEWQGPTGPKWVMEGLVDDIGGVVLIEVSGMVPSVDRSAIAVSHRRGVRLGPLVVGEMTGSLRLVARGNENTLVGDVYEAFERCLSTDETGLLTVVDGRRQMWQVDALLSSPLAVPEMSPRAPGRNVIEFQLPLRAPEGVWRGVTEEIYPGEGGVVTVSNRGSLTTFPTVVWSGAGAVIETPAGVRATLPSVGSPRHLSTDPGRGFVVTTPGGDVDTATWATMRGLPVWGELLPRREARWRVVSGQVHFEMTPLTENPWR